MSGADTHKLCIIRSVEFAPFVINCTQDGTNEPIDLTGWTAHAKAKLIHIPSRGFDLKPAITDAENGVVTISLTGEETMSIPAGLYEWDLILQNPDGKRHGPIICGEAEVITPATMP